MAWSSEIMLLGEAGKIKCLNAQRLIPNKTQNRKYMKAVIV